VLDRTRLLRISQRIFDCRKITDPLKMLISTMLNKHHWTQSASNVGFRLLQKMGWKGKGLGKDEQGMSLVEPNGCTGFACHPLVMTSLM
jgi:hypothetical protein